MQTSQDHSTRERPASTTRSQVDDEVAATTSTEVQRRDTASRKDSSNGPAQVPDRRRTDPGVLTVDEAAALLRVDRKSIYESIRRGELPGVVRVGRAIRISRTALLQWLSGQVRVSRSEATR